MKATGVVLDNDGDALEVFEIPHGVMITVNEGDDKCSGIFGTGEQVDAIIGHLQRLRVKMFGEKDDGFEPVYPYPLAARAILRRLDSLDRPCSTMEMVRKLDFIGVETIKETILFLGDSRRPDRELDLSRDDRTEAMMSDEEKQLTPQDEFGRYYCSVQRRKA